MPKNKKGQVAALKRDMSTHHSAVTQTGATTTPTSKTEVREKTNKSPQVPEGELQKLHDEILREVGRIVGKPHLELVERASMAMLQDLEGQAGNDPIPKRADLFNRKGCLTPLGVRYLIWEHNQAFIGDFTTGTNYPVEKLKLILTEKTFRFFEAKRAKEKEAKRGSEATTTN